MFELFSIINTLPEEKHCPVINITPTEAVVRKSDNAQPIYLFNRKDRTLFLFIVAPHQCKTFLTSIEQSEMRDHCSLWTNHRIALPKKAPNRFFICGHLDVTVNSPHSSNFHMVATTHVVVRAYLGTNQHAICTVQERSKVSLCGSTKKLSVRALSEDSCLDLTGLESTNSEHFILEIAKDAHAENCKFTPIYSEPVETEREQQVRNIHIPDDESSSFSSDSQNFECQTCCKTRRRPVEFIPCGHKYMCSKCAHRLKCVKHSKFSCPLCRVEIKKVL